MYRDKNQAAKLIPGKSLSPVTKKLFVNIDLPSFETTEKMKKMILIYITRVCNEYLCNNLMSLSTILDVSRVPKLERVSIEKQQSAFHSKSKQTATEVKGKLENTFLQPF